jgi:hypothetical protein
MTIACDSIQNGVILARNPAAFSEFVIKGNLSAVCAVQDGDIARFMLLPCEVESDPFKPHSSLE